MANTERWGANWLQVVLDGSGDWTCSLPKRFRSMFLGPSAANDKLVVAEVVPTAASASDYPRKSLTSTDGGEVAGLLHFSSPAKLLIPYSECTFNTVANVIVTFDFN